MIMDIMDTLNEVGSWLEKFMDNNYDNPFFWLFLFLALFIIACIVIGKLADK